MILCFNSTSLWDVMFKRNIVLASISCWKMYQKLLLFYFFLWLIVTHSIFFVKWYIHMHIHIYVSIYIDIYIYICRYRYTYFSIRTWTNHDILFWQGLCQSPFMTFILKVILVLRHPAGILPMPTSRRVRLLPTGQPTGQRLGRHLNKLPLNHGPLPTPTYSQTPVKTLRLFRARAQCMSSKTGSRHRGP